MVGVVLAFDLLLVALITVFVGGATVELRTGVMFAPFSSCIILVMTALAKLRFSNRLRCVVLAASGAVYSLGQIRAT